MHEGHRKRILERALCFPGSLEDHELLEIVLFNVIPRQNTNPLAHRLLEGFGDLNGVFDAENKKLAEFEGVGEGTLAYLSSVAEMFRRMRNQPPKEIPVRDEPTTLFNVHEFIEYLKGNFRPTRYEHLEVYCLDTNSNINFIKVYTNYSFTSAGTGPEDLLFMLATKKPFAIAVAHNHPTGEGKPSETDDAFTMKLQLLCSMCNVNLYDHVILPSEGEPYSYSLSGKLDDFRERITVERLIAKEAGV